jgi:hypothetical protein
MLSSSERAQTDKVNSEETASWTEKRREITRRHRPNLKIH